MIVGWGKQTNLTASRTRFIRSSQVMPNMSDNQADLVKRVSQTSETSQKFQKNQKNQQRLSPVKGKAGGGIIDG